MHFCRAAAVQSRCDLLLQRLENGLHLRPFRAAGKLHGAVEHLLDQLAGIQLQALAGIARRAPCLVQCSQQ
ncbi:hypothetical protein D3C80_1218760 [compost metagenome]